MDRQEMEETELTEALRLSTRRRMTAGLRRNPPGML
jgi:hypothetical protein